ncbi:MAG: hypothetical protein HZB26_24800 [Candidatus Hydrogenedentes bacterium]|nr:hypothetical protein [Candidatus Hydrogenedentota bacterium]
MKIPRIEDAYTNVYKPSGDVYPGPAAGPLAPGKYYEKWVPNDHCFVRDEHGRWHCFGITHPESGVEEIHAGEYQSFHALAPAGTLKSVLREGAWKDEAKVLPPSARPGEIPENHAPCIVKTGHVYQMIYGPHPLRRATSRDLYMWVPQGIVANSPITRDPNLLLWKDTYHVLTCGQFDVRMAKLDGFTSCGESRVILTMPDKIDPESPTLIQRDGTFYLFVCGWNGIWDKKDIEGAYQHVTYVYQSDDPFRFDAGKEVTRLNAHAPEIFQDEDGDWYISSVEWPHRGVSIARLVWE